MQVKDGPDGGRYQENQLNLKVVLQNLKLIGEEGPPVFAQPGDHRPLIRLTVFYVFEVFDFKKVAGPASNNELRIYYLIGRSGPNRELKGWMREDDLYV